MNNHLRCALGKVNTAPEGLSYTARHASFIVRWLSCIVLLGAVVQTSYAHPGHSLTDHGVTHIVSSPYHLFVLTGFSLALWGAAYFARQARIRRLLQIGAAAFAAAAIIWNWLG